MLTLSRPLEGPARVTTASPLQPLTPVHPFGLAFARRQQVRFVKIWEHGNH
jgi:hypothetical protein